MIVAYVKGLQGPDPRYWLTASLLKHYLANSNEDTRSSSSSDFDDRLYREYYSVGFRMGIVDGGSRAFMAAYNAVNGIPMAVSPLLKLARDEWGQDGMICTDGGALDQLLSGHHYYTDINVAAAQTLRAGITKYLDRHRDATTAALSQNLITVADLDQAVRENLRILLKLGLLDPPSMVPYSTIGTGPEPWSLGSTRALARRVADESVVLLKNSAGFLPLDPAKIKSIAVIGPRADKVYIDWYGGLPPYAVTPLDGIKARLGPGVQVMYAPDNDLNQAARIARMCDVAVVCVGNHPDGGDNSKWGQVEVPSEGREAVDRKSIDLEQEALIQQVFQANHRTVVALISSFPYAIDWTQATVPAIVHMTHSSQEEGNALAGVLFGDYDPGGKLVQTWPASMDQLPPLMDYNIRDGRTYMYFKGKPLYPFGYGLSYTSFAYSNLRTSAPRVAAPGTIIVSVDVKNTGARAGDDVVELYVRHIGSAVPRPGEQLAGFRRVSIAPGKAATVTIPLRASQLAYWDTGKQSFVIESDKIELRIARSATDIALRKTIPVVATPGTELVSARGE
jgi:beta-glucosidase